MCEMKFAVRSVLFCCLILSPRAFGHASDDARWPLDQWSPIFHESVWSAGTEGSYRVSGTGDTGRLAPLEPSANGMIEARIRVEERGGSSPGVILRGTQDHRAVVVRFDDRAGSFQMIIYRAGRIVDYESSADRISFKPGKWYQMKAALIDGVVLAKLWQEEQDEPDWQLHIDVENRRPIPDDGREVGPGDWVRTAEIQRAAPPTGRVGLYRYNDDTAATFANVHISTKGESIDAVRRDVQAFRRQAFDVLMDNTELCLSIAPFAQEIEGRPMRRVHVSMFAEGRRTPVRIGGELQIRRGDEQESYMVAATDWQEGLYTFHVPESDAPVEIRAEFRCGGHLMTAQATLEPGTLQPWAYYVRECLDTLLERGTDRYGEKHTPVLMSIIDIKTLAAPRIPPLYDGYVRTEGRRHRRAEGGANLWNDQATLRAMYLIGKQTGDPKYARAADAYFEYVLKNCKNDKGLPLWGSHCHYDAYADAPGGDVRGGGVHEILIRKAEWRQLYRSSPERLLEVGEAIWQHHVQDKQTGMHNRHDSAGTGDFAFSGGSIASAFSCLYEKTGDEKWLHRAQLIADWHWIARNPQTGLAPTSPASPYPTNFNGHHASTQLVGPFAAQLLDCYRYTGDLRFQRYANTFIKAYDRFGWDPDAKTYWGAIRLDRTAFAAARIHRVMEDKPNPSVSAIDATPLKDKKDFHNYAWAPDGHVDMWKTIVYSWEFPVEAAQASIYAYNLCGDDPARRDPELLAIARRWAVAIEGALPPSPGRRFHDAMLATLPRVKDTGGTYAENYGRAISFFTQLYRATGEEHYLNVARQLAEEAVRKLYENGLFRGHPAKDNYDALDGVGLLLCALLDLDQPNEPMDGAF